MITFYIAASYAAQAVMRERKNHLQAMGHRVTSRWIDQDEAEDSFTSQEAEHRGSKDLEDIDNSWVVLFFTDVPSTTGGLHVEFGYSLAQGKMLVIIGPATNIFHKQATFQYDDWNTFLREYPL